MEFQLQNALLRPWRTGDETSLEHHANNRKVWINVRDHFPFPYTHRDAVRWIQYATSQLHGLVFAVEVQGRAVGNIGLTPKDDIYKKTMEIGYWLGEDYWGRGIMTEAVGVITKYGFSSFDCLRIYADVFDWNPASARVLEKNNYLFEGRFKKGFVKDGAVGDLLMYAVTV